MEHSTALENHARKKTEKLAEFLQEERTPSNIEFHLACHPNHAHQEVSIHLQTKNLRLNTEAEGVDGYAIIDVAIDKMITLVKKNKEKMRDSHRQSNDKWSNFE